MAPEVKAKKSVAQGAKIVIGVVLGLFLLLLIAQIGQKRSGAELSRIREEAKEKFPAPRPPSEEEAQQQGQRWSYSESHDEMGPGRVKTAFVRSLNTFEFGFPYQGTQRAELQLKIHPRYGNSVILCIERGQFLCSQEDYAVEVRFDEGKPQRFRAVGPADNGTTTLFLQDYSRFLSNARNAKEVRIEAEVYQEGPRVFDFNVSGLKW